MTDSIAIGGDGQANQTLTLLRHEQRSGELASDVRFLPGLDLHADPALGLTGHWRTNESEVLSFEATAEGVGGWVGLHLSLPVETMRGRGVVGFAARIRAPEILTTRACLRSGRADGFVDCFFDKHLLFMPEEASHVDALQISQRDTIPEEAPWRELILFLPAESFRLSLLDWRVFVV
ncbi:MAG: hypothetical protein QNJ09_00810 [Paracoccaceae bacterium]|nr:hypothetical protein [Paracoccaceae bacterium]